MGIKRERLRHEITFDCWGSHKVTSVDHTVKLGIKERQRKLGSVA